jgi:hypothetical protein
MVQHTTSSVIGKTLNNLPGAAMHHLTVLWSAKAILADVATCPGHYCDDGRMGADSAAHVVLGQLVVDPLELCKVTYPGGRLMDGVKLKKALFVPVRGVRLNSWQMQVYKAALHTAEIQLRGLCDTANLV